MSESHWSLRRWYVWNNRKYWDGQLPGDTVVLYQPCNSDRDAECVRLPDSRYEIHIDPVLKSSQCLMRVCLLHEMCHVEVWSAGHGRRFQDAIDRLWQQGAYKGLL